MFLRPTRGYVLGSLLAAAIPFGQAAAMPPPVEAMIREAAKSPDTLGAVAGVAKATNPDAVAEIDALLESLKAQTAAAREARLSTAGVFESWSGSASAGVSTTSGNSSETGFTANVDLAKDGLLFRHKVKAQADHQIISGQVTRNRYLATYELDYKFTERLFTYGLMGWDRDTFSGFSRRFSESGGLGYALLQTQAITLNLTGGPALRQTRYVTGLSGRSYTGRAGLDAGWKLYDRLTFTEVASVYVGDGMTATSALIGKITETLSARASFEVDHEDQIPAGRKATDTMTRFALVLGF